LKESLLVLVDTTRRDVKVLENQPEAFRRHLEGWYVDSMNEIADAYKHWARRLAVIVAFIVVVGLNADTLMLVQRLTMDGAFRVALVNAAQDAAKLPPVEGGTADTRVNAVLDRAKDVNLPLGWALAVTDPRHIPLEKSGWDFSGWLLFKVFGLLITVSAVSLGAPFWFDMLGLTIKLKDALTGKERKSEGVTA
jgi:hypothetical protein